MLISGAIFHLGWFHHDVCHQETIHLTLTEWSYHKGGLSLYPNIEAVLLMSFTEVYLTAVTWKYYWNQVVCLKTNVCE